VDFVTTTEARGGISQMLNDVMYRGKSFTITRTGRPAAKLVPIGSDENVADPTASLVPPPGAAVEPQEKTLAKTPGKTPGKTQNPGKTR